MMFCKNCGKENEEQTTFCVHCGASLQEAVAEPVAQAVAPIIPEEYQPLSPWAYFGLTLLFSIPIVGFIFLIIFSCNGSNINRRNFARSYWCSLIIVGGILLVCILLAMIAGFSFYNVGKEAVFYQ